MKKETAKTTDGQLLDLLKRVLPKATHDPKLAGKIYEAVESELKAAARATAFQKFCAKVELPDLEAKTVAEIRDQIGVSFGDGDITIKPDRKNETLAIEVALPDGSQFASEIKVNPNVMKESDSEQEINVKLAPFPVCMPGDKELVWLMAKRENMTPDEGAIALSKLQEDFWGSKTGQKLLRDRVERSFPEFVARVPSGMLREAGLKRHHKTPEAIKTLRAR